MGLLFQISLVNSPKWAGMVNTEALCSLDGSARHYERKAAGPLCQEECGPRAPLDSLGSQAGVPSSSSREISANAWIRSAMLTEHPPCARPCPRCWGFSQGQKRSKSCSHGAYLPQG